MTGDKDLLKINKIIYCLLILAVLILIICSNSVNATNLDENNLTDTSDHEIENSDISYAKIEDKKIEEKSDEKKIVKTDTTKNTKESDKLHDISLEEENIECDYGDIVDINVVTTPEVEEGVLSFYVNERLVGAKNLSILLPVIP